MITQFQKVVTHDTHERNTATVTHYKRHPLGSLTRLLGHRGTVLSLLFVVISICLLLQRGKLRACTCDLICTGVDYIPVLLLFSLIVSSHHYYSTTPITITGWLHTKRFSTDVATCSKRNYAKGAAFPPYLSCVKISFTISYHHYKNYQYLEDPSDQKCIEKTRNLY